MLATPAPRPCPRLGSSNRRWQSRSQGPRNQPASLPCAPSPSPDAILRTARHPTLHYAESRVNFSVIAVIVQHRAAIATQALRTWRSLIADELMSHERFARSRPMTTLHFGQQRGRQFSQNRGRHGGQFSLLLIAFAVIALGAFGYVGYVLWPRWPAPRLDAPALPITVAGVAFNLSPAAIRRATQRRSGAHERVDLVFLWPSLVPPDPAAKPSAAPHGTVAEASPAGAPGFMTILSAGDTLAAGDRALPIYPGYTAGE